MFIVDPQDLQGRMLSCKISLEHSRETFIPTSRFSKEKLQALLQNTHEVLLQGHQGLPARARYFEASMIDYSLTSSTILRIPRDRLKGEEFRLFLAQRVPLVITHLNDRLQLAWSPNQLTEDYGTQVCTMDDCESVADSIQTTFGNFLSHFKSSTNKVIWKVKVRIFLTDFDARLHITQIRTGLPRRSYRSRIHFCIRILYQHFLFPSICDEIALLISRHTFLRTVPFHQI
jgi:hypothetical protein